MTLRISGRIKVLVLQVFLLRHIIIVLEAFQMLVLQIYRQGISFNIIKPQAPGSQQHKLLLVVDQKESFLPMTQIVNW